MIDDKRAERLDNPAPVAKNQHEYCIGDQMLISLGHGPA